MKKLFYLFCLAVVSSVVFSACEKEEVLSDVIANEATSSALQSGDNNDEITASSVGGEEKCSCRYQITSLSKPSNDSQFPQSAVAIHYPWEIPFIDESYSRIHASYNPADDEFTWQTFSQGMSTSGFMTDLPSDFVGFLPGDYQNFDIQTHTLDMFTYIMDDDNPQIGVKVRCNRKKELNERNWYTDFNYTFTRPLGLGNTDNWSEEICVHCADVSLIECL